MTPLEARWRCPTHEQALLPEGKTLTCPAGHRFALTESDGASYFEFLQHTQLTTLEQEQRATYDSTDSRYAVEALGQETDFVRRCAETFARRGVKGREEQLRHLADGIQLTAAHRVLELGCNDGRYLNAFHRRYGASGVGIDLSAEAVRRALALRVDPSLEFHVARADALPFADATFDAVISFDVFEHLGHEAVRRTLAEVCRVLRPSGVLLCYVISQRDQFTFHETLRRLTHGRYGVDDGEGHAFENFVAPDAFRDWCSAAGLRVERVQAYHGFWTLFADEHLRGAPPRLAYKLLEWLDAPLTNLEYGNGFFGLARKAAT